MGNNLSNSQNGISNPKQRRVRETPSFKIYLTLSKKKINKRLIDDIKGCNSIVHHNQNILDLVRLWPTYIAKLGFLMGIFKSYYYDTKYFTNENTIDVLLEICNTPSICATPIKNIQLLFSELPGEPNEIRGPPGIIGIVQLLLRDIDNYTNRMIESYVLMPEDLKNILHKRSQLITELGFNMGILSYLDWSNHRFLLESINKICGIFDDNSDIKERNAALDFCLKYCNLQHDEVL